MPTHLWQALLVIIFRKHVVLMQTSQENGTYTHTHTHTRRLTHMPTHLWQVLLVIIFREHVVLIQTSQENGAYTHTYQEAHTYAFAPLAGPPRHHLP